jgi:hypothetical protein
VNRFQVLLRARRGAPLGRAGVVGCREVAGPPPNVALGIDA